MAKDKKKSNAARPLNRFGLGSLSVIQTVLLATILLGLNYLSFNHFYRVDLSEQNDYSLSPATKNYLTSEALTQREKPITWIMAYRRTSPLYERVRAVAEEYARLSKGKINLQLVDPNRNSDRMQEIIAAYGITLARDIIIMDARSDESAVMTEDADRLKVLNPNIKIVLAEEMAVFGITQNERKLIGFQGEDVLTSRLVESIEGKPRKMALISDKSQLGKRGSNPSIQSLEKLLRFQNIELSELELSTIKTIPEEISGVIIAAPKYDLTEAEIEILESYWNTPRAAILTFLDADQTPPNLKAFLRSNGITPQADRIIAKGQYGNITAAKGNFTRGVPFLTDLAGQSSEFGGASASLDVREGDDDLLDRRIYPVGIFEVDGRFWGETRFGTGIESYDEREDNASPLYLAASSTRGAQADDRFADETSRMMVITNTDFLNPIHHRAENLDFLASSVNWLIGRESLIGIGPRSFVTYKLPLYQAQAAFINRVNLVFIPIALFIIGVFVWSYRRS